MSLLKHILCLKTNVYAQSELMRRATPAPEVFNNTLRRQSVPGSLPTGTHRPGIVPTKVMTHSF